MFCSTKRSSVSSLFDGIQGLSLSRFQSCDTRPNVGLNAPLLFLARSSTFSRQPYVHFDGITGSFSDAFSFIFAISLPSMRHDKYLFSISESMSIISFAFHPNQKHGHYSLFPLQYLLCSRYQSYQPKQAVCQCMNRP